MDAINLYVLCQAIDLDNFGDYKDTLTKSGNSLDSRINMTRLVPQLRVLHKSQPA